ncbi:GAF domain-containing protein [Streptomyces endophyticus]|uniref:GAF domain-containing protein n=1 Tax=Streptomyces endophyticus TaxID=714166 RepID=A0ABU6FED8_9ACTN|nr:GAF domain-containing protein [Streptomyces endophyticus]MEB8342416.1 GAF domain-containing protein [Streptomyces endophyticus]
MPYDALTGFHNPAADPELAARAERLKQLGLGEPDAHFDRLATELANAADTPYAMVNLITDQQFFVGLHTPEGTRHTMVPQDHTASEVGRVMSRDHGYCPEVLSRRKPLVLPDVYAAPRFAGNPVVDELGIRVYLGAPLIDPQTDLVLGTVCAVGTEPRSLDSGHNSLQLIKQVRDDAMRLIYERAGERLP